MLQQISTRSPRPFAFDPAPVKGIAEEGLRKKHGVFSSIAINHLSSTLSASAEQDRSNIKVDHC